MIGCGREKELFWPGIFAIHLFRHARGDKAIPPPMNKQDGSFSLFQLLLGGALRKCIACSQLANGAGNRQKRECGRW